MPTPSDNHRPQHRLRASAHACPRCGTHPLIIIFQHQSDERDVSYWFDCPNCQYTSASQAVPSTNTEQAPGEFLTEDRVDEFVATIDTNPPF